MIEPPFRWVEMLFNEPPPKPKCICEVAKETLIGCVGCALIIGALIAPFLLVGALLGRIFL